MRTRKAVSVIGKFLLQGVVALAIIVFLFVALLWTWDYSTKLKWYVRHPITQEYLTIVMRSSFSSDFSYIYRGKRWSRFDPFPGEQYLNVEGPGTVSYSDSGWVLIDMYELESTMADTRDILYESIPSWRRGAMADSLLFDHYRVTSLGGGDGT